MRRTQRRVHQHSACVSGERGFAYSVPTQVHGAIVRWFTESGSGLRGLPYRAGTLWSFSGPQRGLWNSYFRIAYAQKRSWNGARSR